MMESGIDEGRNILEKEDMLLSHNDFKMVGCIGVERHFNSKGHIMAVDDAHVFPGFLTPVLTQLFFPTPPTTFLKCFCIGVRLKYAGKKVCFNLESNSQPPGHESDTLTTELPPPPLPRVGAMTSKAFLLKVFKILD